MKKTITTLCTLVALSIPAQAEAIIGLGSCYEKRPVTITVHKGDTLISLAKTYYGNQARYKDIAKQNKIKHPNRISIGQILSLPDKTYYYERLVSVSDFSVAGYCNIKDTPPITTPYLPRHLSQD